MKKEGKVIPYYSFNSVHVVTRFFSFFFARQLDRNYSVNIERTFCYPRILPKNEQNNSSIVLLGKKPNSFVRFLEESEDTKGRYEII